MWRVFFVLILLLPQQVHAAETQDLEIYSDLTLSGQMTYHNIHIHQGATLFLLAGTDLHMTFGGNISGEGNLDARGTEVEPVLLEGSNWTGIDLTGETSLSWVTIFGAIGPFFFHGATATLSHLRLQDIQRSELYLSGVNAVLHDVKMLWDTIPYQQRQIGIYLAHVQHIDLADITFPRRVDLGEWDIMQISGGYTSLSYSNLATSDGCSVRKTGNESFWNFTADGNCTVPEPSLLFVPGFGSSLNLPYLFDPAPAHPTYQDWKLIPFLTNSYKYFLEEAELRNIRVSIAYYDWRQRLPFIVQQYLIPAIEALKQRDHVSQVYLVAHSFGGIVARAYIQSGFYHNDVAGLVELGTPNQGAPKAYGPWEGGVFPEDWSAVSNLLRTYRYLSPSGTATDLEALRTFIPSVQDLLPTGDVLHRPDGTVVPLREEVNSDLFDLKSSVDLLRKRLSLFFTIAGTGQTTVTDLRVGEAHPGAPTWPDGETIPGGELSLSVGDGTVPYLSTGLPFVSGLTVAAAHQDIPAQAAELVLQLLYPTHVRKAGPPLQGASRTTTHILWFTFDCPVTVSITTPSGKVVTSLDGESSEAAVFTNPQATWMLIPQETGEYHLTVTALADTPVRWWQGVEPIHAFDMKRGEVKEVAYTLGIPEPLSPPIPSPQPFLPTPLPTASESPQPVLEFPSLTPIFEAQVVTTQQLSFLRDVPPPVQIEKTQRKEPLRVPYILVWLPILVLLQRKSSPQLPPHHPP
jgi:hypothetical protein